VEVPGKEVRTAVMNKSHPEIIATRIRLEAELLHTWALGAQYEDECNLRRDGMLRCDPARYAAMAAEVEHRVAALLAELETPAVEPTVQVSRAALSELCEMILKLDPELGSDMLHPALAKARAALEDK
jgi:hypothetical protein